MVQGPDRPPVALWQARLSGALAAVVALTTGELLSAFGGTEQSLIASVGSSFIDQFAGALKNLAVSLFGTSDKAALVIGIVAVGALIGAALGTATTRRPWVGPAGFVAFAAFGIVAGLRDPLVTSPFLVVVAAAGAAGAGIVALRVLLRVAATGSPLVTTGGRLAPRTPPPVPDDEPARPPAAAVTEWPGTKTADRRSFFGYAGAAAAFSVVATAGARALAGRSAAEVAIQSVKLPTVTGGSAGTVPLGTTAVAAEAPLGVEGLTPYLIANKDFYRIDTALVVPQVDPADWKLSITGMVDHPFEITFDELLAMSQTEEVVTLSCVSNEVGGDLVGNARWQGVPLDALLERAGVQPGATQIVGRSVDGFTAGFPTSVARDGRVAMVAVGMNGEPLPIPHGFPARLVIAGLYGYVSATKWLKEIQLTTWEDVDGYWIPRGWSKEGPIKTGCRIDVPRQNAAPIAAGPAKVAGVAWAPSRGISKVEVQVDDGPWMPARLGEAVSGNTWVQWVADWDATPGNHALRARATDGTGATQTADIAPPDPNGATGHPVRRVNVA